MHAHIRSIVAATAVGAMALAGLSGCAASAGSDEPLVGLVIKTQDNPFYVKMTEGAKSEAESLGLNLQIASGDGQSDVDSQITAIENLTAKGAKAILVTPAGDGIIPAIRKAQQAGVLVFALDSPLAADSGVDGTFATDNRLAGELVGQWAREALGDTEPRIATLDLNSDQIPVDVARNQGFLEGFGIDLADDTKMWDEDDPRFVGHEVTDANEAGGRTGMEKLLQKDPTINLVYTVNEPAAAGAYQAIVAAGLQDQIMIVSIDGGCPGIANVEKGIIDATSMQFPLDMAAQALQAVDAYLADGTKPQNSEGLDFTNTGVTLITDQPQAGIESEDSAFGLEECWG
ncbi:MULTISPECIES: substrate-binding domain-containing protein [unclassified Microbacterium]|uniref:substrate-binding domain-containing protein n=1 Tax=unclassified Microbacterium TaxID=2609290 RepID=UPI00342D6A66